MSVSNPLAPILGPFRASGGGGTVVVEGLPDGLVSVSIYQGPTRASNPGPELLGSVVLSGLNWAALLEEMRVASERASYEPCPYGSPHSHRVMGYEPNTGPAELPNPGDDPDEDDEE